MCCDIKIWRFQNILLYSKAIKHNKNWDFCTFSIDAFDFLFWPSPMEILQIRGRLTSPWQKGPSDNLCLCHRCNRKEVFSQKLKVSAPMVVTSTSTPKSRKVQFRHVLSEIHGNHCPIALQWANKWTTRPWWFKESWKESVCRLWNVKTHRDHLSSHLLVILIWCLSGHTVPKGAIFRKIYQ